MQINPNEKFGWRAVRVGITIGLVFLLRVLLGCRASQLCKSIIMENTAWQPLRHDDDGTSASNSRFYLVVVQCVFPSTAHLEHCSCV